MRSGGVPLPKAHGRHSTEELKKKTEEICGPLDKSAGIHVIHPSAMRTYHADGTVQHIWRMDYQTASGQSVADIMWDADTAQILTFRRPLPFKRTTIPAINQRQAAELARIWMSKIGIAQRGGRWQQVGEAMLTDYEWRSKWQSGDWIVSLFIDAGSGELRLAHTTRASWRLQSR